MIRGNWSTSPMDICSMRKAQNGKYLFRDRFFQTLTDYEEEYWALLEKHIGKHLTSLGSKKGERTWLA